ncbi:formyl transferase [Methyloceanibacter sp.]|uniref:formyl transferase n=1 Tax=Methyloceanibacter sp. TaxID=1965321 RepID=UPI002C734E3B|nr:formyl transferase [Methyloceanibacter sp.]HML93298.1 formyl transferase [Methyloceanibacter sp.]
MAKVISAIDTNAAGRVVLLIAGGALAAIVVNYLADRFTDLIVLKEVPESKWVVFRRRARVKGLSYAVGQAFCALFLKGVARLSRARVRQVYAQYGLSSGWPTNVDLRKIDSVNSETCRRLLRELKPDVVAVYGTRIISEDTLRAVDVPFINYHAGITPEYRGQHPAYWALVNDDPDRVGVTIHLVDEGVDTGGVLYQAPVSFTPSDNITTYQYVQMASALPLFVRSIEDALARQITTREFETYSRHWYPPTLVQYFFNGAVRSVW